LAGEKCPLSTSQLFQKKRLCFNPAAPEAQNLQHQEEEEEEEEEENEEVEEDEEEEVEEDEEEEEGTSEEGGYYQFSGDSPESPGSWPGSGTPLAAPLTCEGGEYTTFTVSQKSVVKLLYLLDKMEAPDYAFQRIMEWARDCQQQGFDFSPCMMCKANITWMYSSIHNAKHMLPHLEATELSDPLPKMLHVDVICYDFSPASLTSAGPVPHDRRQPIA
jgi:hypothetical protein